MVNWVLSFFVSFRSTQLPLFVAYQSQLYYFLWNVIFTLAAVEAPQIVVPAPWTDKKNDGDEVPRIQQERSITKSLLTTVRHLYSIGGLSAACRGMALHISHMIAVVVISAPVGFLWFLRTVDFDAEKKEIPGPQDWSLQERLTSVCSDAAADAVCNLLLCSWHATWVHIVITQPTLRIWYRRLPPFLQTLRATWIPLLALPLADTLLQFLSAVLQHYLGLFGKSEATAGLITSRNIQKMLVWLLCQSLNAWIVIVLNVALIRVQASLLPEEEETIIPFDRSFGLSGTSGLRPGLLAESRGVLSFRDARRSITRMEIRRLLIISIKLLAVQGAVNAIFWPAMGNSVWPEGWNPMK